MNSKPNRLQRAFDQWVRWERRKRYERVLISLGFYALAGGLVLVAVNPLAPWMSSWLAPLALAAVLAPWFLWRGRWRSRDSVRVMAGLDKALRLDERALTAWEILARQGVEPTETLVLEEAAARLPGVDPRILSPRRATWQLYSMAPLLALWFALLWLGTGARLDAWRRPPHPGPLAQKLTEFARQLQEKAAAEGLRESLDFGRELENIAQKQTKSGATDERLSTEIASATRKIEAMTGAAASQDSSFAGAENPGRLRDLKTELEVARDTLNLPRDHRPERASAELFDRLSGLPQLRRQLEKNFSSRESLGGEQLKSFLDGLEKKITDELDRQTLLEAQQFLEQLLKNGQSQGGKGEARVAGSEKQGSPDPGQKRPSASNLPGTEPGVKEGASDSLPQFHSRAATHLKGLLREGESAGMVLKGTPAAGKAELPEQDVITSYQRRAEADLYSERVPQALKETVRNYFLSLRSAEEGK